MSNVNINGKDAADALLGGAKKVIDKAVTGAEKLTDIAALKIKIASVKAKRDEEYTRLGKLTYKKLKSDTPDTDTAAKIAQAVKNIDSLTEQLAQLEKQAK
ncbi:MAG: hypothetical protein E7589_03620 [Ruminococcaceae bacterium]|nr:hypothetical protein [Oscillospiraceae bacterium]